MRSISASLSLALLVATASARSVLLDRCGSDAQIIETKSLGFTAKNAEIILTTRACTNSLSSSRNKPRNSSLVHKRTVVQEGDECASITCNPTGEQPTQEDCIDMANSLGTMTTFFTVPADSTAMVSSENCEFIYANGDDVAYSVFIPTIGTLALRAVSACAAKTPISDPNTAGICFSPEVPHNDWAVESIFI